MPVAVDAAVGYSCGCGCGSAGFYCFCFYYPHTARDLVVSHVRDFKCSTDFEPTNFNLDKLIITQEGAIYCFAYNFYPL